MTRRRLAIMGSHPIPYRVGLYRMLAARDDLEILALYGTDYGVRSGPSDWGMQDFVWNADLVSGYPHLFLRNIARHPHPSRFFGRVNPGLPVALKRFAPHAVLSMGYGALYHVLGLASALALDVPVLYTSDTNHSLAKSGVGQSLKNRVLETLYRRITAFLVTGTRHREHFEAFGVPATRMFDFPWSVDNEHFRAQALTQAPERQALREQWGIAPGAFCAVFVAKLWHWKNAAELLLAAASLADVHVLLVGSGPERPALESLAAQRLPGRCTFAGFLNQDELGQAYAAADVFVMPSRFDPWGLTCNEAMNFGLPIIVSDRVGAGADLVVPEVTGWIYPSGDEGALRRALVAARQAVAQRGPALHQAVLDHIRSFDYRAQLGGVLSALDFATGAR